jgi:hypothetical protein
MEYRRKTWGNVTHERLRGSVDQRADVSRETGDRIIGGGVLKRRAE